MTLQVHRLIDALHGRGSDGVKFHRLDPDGRALLGLFKRDLPKAEMFDFGHLHLEPGERTGEYIAPKLSNDELEMWSLGLIPLPAPACWFEFTLGETRSGFYVVSNAAGWACTRVDRVIATDHYVWFPDSIWYQFQYGTWVNGKLPTTIVDGSGVLKALRESTQKQSQIEYRSTIQTAVLVLYLALMINSRTTEVSRAPAGPKLTYTAARKGATREFAHTVIEIIPKAYRTGTGIAGKGSGPKRLHWRRSHLRRYDHQTPGAKWCGGLTAPDGTPGCFAVVIPRFLVGSRELGEITHEYHISERSQSGDATCKEKVT